MTARLNLVDIAATAHACAPEDAPPLTPAELFDAYERAKTAVTDAFGARADADLVRRLHRHKEGVEDWAYFLLSHYPGGIATPLGVYRAEHHGRVARYDLPTPLDRVAWPGADS